MYIQSQCITLWIVSIFISLIALCTKESVPEFEIEFNIEKFIWKGLMICTEGHLYQVFIDSIAWDGGVWNAVMYES